MGSERRGPGRPGDDVDRRREIVEAAARVFAAEGFGAPLRAVADEAQVTPAAIYHYFGSKEELLVEAVMEVAGLLDIAQAADDFGEGLEQALGGLARQYLRSLSQDDVLRVVLLVLASGERVPEALNRVASGLEGVVLPLSSRLAAEQEAGRVRADLRPELVIQCLFGSLFSYLLLKRVMGAPWLIEVDENDMAATVATLLAGGLTAERGRS